MNVGSQPAAGGGSLPLAEPQPQRGGPLGAWLSTFGAGSERGHGRQQAVGACAARSAAPA